MATKVLSNRKPPRFHDVSHRSALWPFKGQAPSRVYISDCEQWIVMVFRENCGGYRMGIRQNNKGAPRTAREIVVTWSFIQQIKELVFPGRLAVEIYPDSNSVVDVAPMRWLFILPTGFRLPFNLRGDSDELMAS